MNLWVREPRELVCPRRRAEGEGFAGKYTSVFWVGGISNGILLSALFFARTD